MKRSLMLLFMSRTTLKTTRRKLRRLNTENCLFCLDKILSSDSVEESCLPENDFGSLLLTRYCAKFAKYFTLSSLLGDAFNKKENLVN